MSDSESLAGKKNLSPQVLDKVEEMLTPEELVEWSKSLEVPLINGKFTRDMPFRVEFGYLLAFLTMSGRKTEERLAKEKRRPNEQRRN